MVKQKVNLLLVEDDIDIAEGIADYLESYDIEIDFAYSIGQAKSRLEENSFSLIILDVNLPDGSGIQLCRELKQQMGLSTPIIFLTARGELQDKLLGFEYGAVDYMIKPFALAELRARIHAALLKHTPGQTMLLKVGQHRIDYQRAIFYQGDKPMQLHATGAIIIHELLAHYPKPVSTQRLCDKIWPDSIPQSQPLRAHIHQLRQLFKAECGHELIETVRGVGYRIKLD